MSPLQKPENNSDNVKLLFVTFINEPNVVGSCLSPKIKGFTIRDVECSSSDKFNNRFHSSSEIHLVLIMYVSIKYSNI